MSFPSAGPPAFWISYDSLPVTVRRLARKNCRLGSEEPLHPSLHFKKVSGGNWSIRVGMHYRAIGRFVGDYFLREWIGPHAECDRLA